MKQVLLFICFLSFIPIVSHAQALGNEHWDYRFGIPGTSQYQNVMAVDPRNGDTYAAGQTFKMAGTQRTMTNIAKWTRSTGYWSALGAGVQNSTTGNMIYAMGVNPISGDLYVTGDFASAGGVLIKYFAKWNGTTWDSVGTRIGPVAKVITFNPTNGDMYVGGSFTTINGISIKNIAKWNGTTWSALAGGVDGLVEALAYDQATNTLYAGGQFSHADGKPIKGFAKWDGTSWDSVGGSFVNRFNNVGQIYSISINGGNVYVTGDFNKIGTTSVGYVAKWNGTSWSQLGNFGFPDIGSSYAIASIGSDVFIGGDWYNFTTPPISYLARWDGTQWLAVGGGITGYASTHVAGLATYGNEVYICAPQMSATATIAAKNYVRYDAVTHQWFQLGGNGTQGIDNVIHQMALGPDNDIYVVGSFKGAGNSSALGIAKWDGTSWSGVSKGLFYGTSPSGEARCLAFAPNGDLYVGGNLNGGINDDSSKTQNANYIIKYSGGRFSALSTGFDNNSVNSLVYSGSKLYAGGNFHLYNNNKYKSIVVWDGTKWDSLGAGINGEVNSIAIAPNGDLYAGGNFTSAGGNTSIQNIARWDGSSWSALAGGVNSQVNKLIFKGNDLYVGGTFTTVNGNPCKGLAKWNGTAWDSVSSVITSVDHFAFQGDTLIVSGRLTIPGDTIRSLALWDGAQWKAMGSGLQGENQIGTGNTDSPDDILVKGNDIYFCGFFDLAGDKPSKGFARWNSGETISAVHEAPGNVMPAAFRLEQNYPNPFNPTTNIQFYFAQFGSVMLKIYDVLGREVATVLNNEKLPAGNHETSFDASHLSSGVYFYRLTVAAGGGGKLYSDVKKMMLVR